MTGIMLQNKEGKYFDIKENKVYPSGSYKVFQTRNKIAVPYRTTITINGVVLDGISFDTVCQENGKLYVTGEKEKLCVTASTDKEGKIDFEKINNGFQIQEAKKLLLEKNKEKR